MPATVDEIRQLILEQFPDAKDLELTEAPDHRIMGTIISEEFRDLDAPDRNRLVTERIRNKLGYRGLNVGLLFPLAPGEPR